jgi:23S rRNA (adenine2030-N6)-methyltransferase
MKNGKLDNAVKVNHKMSQQAKVCLPPPTKALVLIDPSYELKKDDHQRVVNCIQDSLKALTLALPVWYPVTATARTRAKATDLAKLNVKSC